MLDLCKLYNDLYKECLLNWSNKVRNSKYTNE